MTDVEEAPLSVRYEPPKGMSQAGKQPVGAPGLAWLSENFIHDRGSARKRPTKRRFNAHAPGLSGVRVGQTQHLVIEHRDSDHLQSGSFCISEWFTPMLLPGAGQRWAMAWKGDVLQIASGIGLTFMIGMDNAAGVLTWIAKVDQAGAGAIVTVQGGRPILGVRTRVTLAYDSVASELRLVINGAEVDNQAMTDAPVITDEPIMLDGENPGHIHEGFELWSVHKTDATLLAEMHDEPEEGAVGLESFITGTLGDDGRVVDRVAPGREAYFTPYYPLYRRGPFGGGMVLPCTKSAGSKAVLDTTDVSSSNPFATTNSAWKKNLDGSGVIQWAVQIAGTPLGWFSNFGESRLLDGVGVIEVINTGVDKGKIQAFASDNTGVLLKSTTLYTPGCRISIGLRRNDADLELFINGVSEASSAALTHASVGLEDWELGGSVGGGPASAFFHFDEFTFYGTDPGAAAMTENALIPIPDRLESDKVGSGIGVMSDAFGVIDGSATVTYVPAHSGLIGWFFYAQDDDGFWRAYQINAVNAGVDFTISPVFVGRENSNKFGGIGTLLATNTFGEWDPLFNGNGDVLDAKVPDHLAATKALDLYPGGSLQFVMSRVAGKLRSYDMPCAGMRRYHKEGEITTTLAVFERTLYMADDRWARVWPDEAGLYSVRVLPGDFLARAADGTVDGPPPFASGSAQVHHSYQVNLATVRGKRVLYADGDRYQGSGDGLALLLFIEDGYLKAEWEYDDGAGGATATYYSDAQCVRPGIWTEIKVQLQRDTAGSCLFMVNGQAVAATATAFPTAIQLPWGATTRAERSLFGLRPDSNGAIDDQQDLAGETLLSMVGFVHQVRMGTGLPFSAPATVETGLWADAGTTTLRLALEEGKGWVYADAAAADSVPVCNLSRFLYPVLEGIPLGDNDAPYSLATYRGILYGTNGRGRQIRAEWSGDFDTYPSGWNAGLAGILPPQHQPVGSVVVSGTPALQNGEYTFWYCYLDSVTGRRSNPSPDAKASIALTTQYLEFSGIVPSNDPRVDAIEVYIRHPAGQHAGKVATLPNALQTFAMRYTDAEVRAGRALDFVENGVPPPAKHIRFLLGRAYWGNVEGAAGGVAFSEPLNEEAWDASINIAKVDSSEWRPVTGLGGQFGAIHVYTQTALYRMTPGVGNLFTYSIRLVSTRAGTLHGSGIVETQGIETFLSKDGVMLTDGNEVRPIGRELELPYLGYDDTDDAGIQLRGPSWGVYDTRTRCSYWLYREEGATRHGRAFCQNRRLAENPTWSVLDFYDASCLAETEDSKEREMIMLADSWGYLYRLDGSSQDLDDLAGTLEDGSARALEGLWTTDPIVGPLVGDGARGYTLAIWNEAADGSKADFTVARLRGTPAAAAPVTAELEEAVPFALTAGVTRWALGGVRQRMQLPWVPAGAVEVDKAWLLFDAAFKPVPGGTFLLRWYGTTASSRRPFSDEAVEATYQNLVIPMDGGITPSHGLEKSKAGRKIAVELEYLGLDQLELYELVIRGEHRGQAYGQVHG